MVGRSQQQTHQRGVALIIVLGLVALIGAWASTSAYEDLIALRLQENIQSNMQASQASISALMLALKILKDDAQDSQTDDLEEAWATESPPFPIDEGVVKGQIVDADRFYNLNDLVDSEGHIRKSEYQVLKRLFTLLELNPGLVDSLADWMDVDNQPTGSGGAEDVAYYGLPYRCKNARLDDLEELHLIRGFDDEVIQKLYSVATAYPPGKQAEVSHINLNTAPPEVLMSLFPMLTSSDIDLLIKQRPFSDVSVLKNQPWAKGGNVDRLSVSSQIFIVRTDAQFGRASVREEYMLSRQSGAITLLSRRLLGWQESWAR